MEILLAAILPIALVALAGGAGDRVVDGFEFWEFAGGALVGAVGCGLRLRLCSGCLGRQEASGKSSSHEGQPSNSRRWGGDASPYGLPPA